MITHVKYEIWCSKIFGDRRLSLMANTPLSLKAIYTMCKIIKAYKMAKTSYQKPVGSLVQKPKKKTATASPPVIQQMPYKGK